MRSLYYLATVIGTYRNIIDDYYSDSLTIDKMRVYQKRLDEVANRETSSHYFMREANYEDQYFTGRVEVSNQDYLGQVISYENHLIQFYERNYFEQGDLVEVFTPEGIHLEFSVEKLYNEKKEEVDVARHPDQIYYLEYSTDEKIPEYSMIKIVKRKKERK